MTDVIVYEESICNVKWGTYVLIGLLALIFGILIFFYPGITAAVLVMLFGVLIIVLAFIALISGLMSTSEHGRPLWLLLLAVLGFIVGAIHSHRPAGLWGIPGNYHWSCPVRDRTDEYHHRPH